MRITALCIFLLLCLQCNAVEMAESVLVKKSEHRLYLLKDGKPFKSYHVVFGKQPQGHKEREGDMRTPEGKYVLDYRLNDSSYHRAIHISYPNEADKKHAAQLNVSPGGAVMIHGQKRGLSWLSPLAQRINWTHGCIALSDSDMDEVFASIKPGTPIEIRP